MNDGFDYGERMEDGQYENYPTIEEGEFAQPVRDTYVHVDGCGSTTTMTGDLPESVARDPSYYTKTFCVGCGEHVPVEEVRWKEDGEPWKTEIDQEPDDPHADDHCLRCGCGADAGRKMCPVAGVEDACLCENCVRRLDTEPDGANRLSMGVPAPEVNVEVDEESLEMALKARMGDTEIDRDFRIRLERVNDDTEVLEAADYHEELWSEVADMVREEYGLGDSPIIRLSVDPPDSVRIEYIPEESLGKWQDGGWREEAEGSD